MLGMMFRDIGAQSIDALPARQFDALCAWAVFFSINPMRVKHVQ
jgi:hypothetical protein